MSAPSSTSSAVSRSASRTFAGVHLIAAAVAFARRALSRFAERTVVRGRELRGVRHDRRLVVADAVERGADRGDLAVHHPGRRDEISARVGLGDRGPRVEIERLVVRRRRRREHAAVSVVGVLAQAQIADQDGVVAELVAQRAQRALRDAVRCIRGRAGRRPWSPGCRRAMNDRTPRDAISRASFTSDSSVCWRVRASTRSARARAMPSFTNSGAIRWRGRTSVSRTRSRSAAVRRRRLGRSAGNGMCRLASHSLDEGVHEALDRVRVGLARHAARRSARRASDVRGPIAAHDDVRRQASPTARRSSHRARRREQHGVDPCIERRASRGDRRSSVTVRYAGDDARIPAACRQRSHAGRRARSRPAGRAPLPSPASERLARARPT